MTTISLELAKELQSICKEKGIELPDHYWGWFYQEITETNVLLPMFSNTLSEYLAPAYTLDELLEWLPELITRKEWFSYYDDPTDETEREVYYDFILHKKDKDIYRAIYTWSLNDYDEDTNDEEYGNKEYLKFFDDSNSANAACKLLIWLIKNGLI